MIRFLSLLRLYVADALTFRGVAGQSALFFALIITLGVFAGDLAQDVSRYVSGLSWAALWLVAHVTFQDVFEQDRRTGRLDAFVLSDMPVPWLALARILSLYVAGVLPAALAAPLILNGMDAGAELPPVWLQYATMVPASLAITALAAMAAALLVGGRQGFAMATLLVLPLSSSVVLFGAGCWNAARLALPYQAPLGFMLALSIVITMAAPFLVAAILRMKART